jgi:hypothetical protein
MESTHTQAEQPDEDTEEYVHPEVEDVDRSKGQDEPLVDNINRPADAPEATPGQTADQGVDNIDDGRADLREDLKGDPLGGSTRVPDPDEEANASG